MTAPRPEIFISATTADLGSCRQIIKEALLTLGCAPVEQTNFPASVRKVYEVLRSRIAECQVVIHVAGEVYGAEPQECKPHELRQSDTQHEYEIARLVFCLSNGTIIASPTGTRAVNSLSNDSVSCILTLADQPL